MKTELLRTENLHVADGQRHGLRDVNMLIREGEFVVLMGLHDSGSDALCRLFAGTAKAQSGRLMWKGGRVISYARSDWETRRAFYLGQDDTFIQSFDLAENLFLMKNTSIRQVVINKKAIYSQTDSLLAKNELPFSAKTKASQLTAAEKKLTAIAKAADQGARLIVLHNVATEYSLFEINQLQNLLLRLKNRGIAFLAAENRPEIFNMLSDQVVVVRKNHVAKKLYMPFRLNEGYKAMLGTWSPENVTAQATLSSGQRQALRVENVWLGGTAPLSFFVNRGEIVQIVSIDSGEQTELWETLSLTSPSGYKLFLDGIPISAAHTHSLAAHRIIVEDFSSGRLSVFDNMSRYDNILLSVLKRASGPVGFYRRSIAGVLASDEAFFEQSHTDGEVQGLSRNERLAILLARWRLFNPKAMILHHAFSSADILGRELVQHALYQMTARGTAVVLIESDILSSVPFSHRLLVLKNGEFSSEKNVKGTNHASLDVAGSEQH